MQPDRWRKIEDIFESALDCPLERRSALLDTACGTDSELRREIESLLISYDSSGSTTYSAVADAVAVLGQQNARIEQGRRIGAYRIVREIGRGGMGTVYLAARADDAFQKLVAIKVIRRGIDTEDIIQRFRTERQILAMLDHAHIGRLLDGGTTDDGLPFFVMEYIEGEPIDQYCDRRKLTVIERLKLFQGVCAAVSYAHQNLVIHRDIKPGNVLVTKEGVPRLLDFGIAKVLAAGPGDQTMTGVRPLTPEYASPEQVRGAPVTTASDVYSLGVLLYKLLTGHGPYRRAASSPAEVETAICREQPEKPSVAIGKRGSEARRLRGDLDNIVMMALRKEPQRRYLSAQHLSEDIGRHLAHLPVIARPDTRRYRAAKFIQRNRIWVAAAAIVFVTLTAGIAVTLWQAHVARLEQAKAARINAFLQEMVGFSGAGGGSANQKGHDATVIDMLDDAARRVDTELADQPEVRAELLGTIGGTYMTQAKIDPAAHYLQEAYALNLKLYGPKAVETARVMIGLGGLSYRKGDYASADSWLQKALPAITRHANDGPIELHAAVGLLSDAAFAKRALGQLDQAEALWRQALASAPKLSAKYRGQSIAPKTFLAQLYMDRGDVEHADRMASEASQELRAFGGDRFSLAQSLIDLGNVRRLEARYGEADSLIQEGTALYAQMQGADHPNVAYGLLSLATSQYYQGQYDLAEQNGRKAMHIVETLPKRTNYYATADNVLGRILNKTGRSHQAELLLREALDIRRQYAHRPMDIALAQQSLGECLLTQRRYPEAEPLLVESYQTLKNLQVPGSPALQEARERVALLRVEGPTYREPRKP